MDSRRAHLVTITRQGSASGGFPFSVPVIRSLTSLDVNTAVTFFVGKTATDCDRSAPVVAL